MNLGVNFEPVGKKLFNTNPFAVAFKQSADEGFIAPICGRPPTVT